MKDNKNLPSVIRPYYTVKQLADAWLCSTKTVRRRIQKGEIKAHKFGGQVRISHADRMEYERLRRQK